MRDCPEAALGVEAAKDAYPEATATERRELARRCAVCAEVERQLQRHGLALVHAGPAEDVERAAADAAVSKALADPLEAIWEARALIADRLDETDWQIIEHRLAGLSLAKIAARTGVSPRTVSRRLEYLRPFAKALSEKPPANAEQILAPTKRATLDGMPIRVEAMLGFRFDDPRAEKVIGSLLMTEEVPISGGPLPGARKLPASEHKKLRRQGKHQGNARNDARDTHWPGEPRVRVEGLDGRDPRHGGTITIEAPTVAVTVRRWPFLGAMIDSGKYTVKLIRTGPPRCERCGRYVPRRATGRPPKWCPGARGDRCRRRARPVAP
jgi:hypothetical protein